MKSGGPWNLRGLRPQPRGDERDVAQRIDVSVDEWLNRVIKKSGDDASDRRPVRGAMTEPQPSTRDPRNRQSARYEGRPYREDRREGSDERARQGELQDESQAEPQRRDRDGWPRREWGDDRPRRNWERSDSRERGRNESRRDDPGRKRPQDWQAGRGEPGDDAVARDNAKRDPLVGNAEEARRLDAIREAAREAAREETRREAAARAAEDERRVEAAREAVREEARREAAARAAENERRLEAARKEARQQAAEEAAAREAEDERRLEVAREVAREEARQETARAAEEERRLETARRETVARAAEDAQRRDAAAREAEEARLLVIARDEARRVSAPARQGIGEMHTRLDQLTQQIERLSRAAARPRTPPSMSASPADELQPRLTGAPQRRRARRESNLSIDDAVAEIAARQRALDGGAATARMPLRESVAAAAAAPPLAESGEIAVPAEKPAAPVAPVSAPTVDFSGLELQLRQITARIEALQPSSDIEKGISSIRSDLADIGRQLNEALPRRAVESLEIEIKALGERIDHSRQSGIDPDALAGLERGLTEIRETLRVLTPAESLVGFEETVRALSQKVDMILAKDDPSALQQLETAIGGLRGVVSHVASNDTLARVAEEVRALAGQVDVIANNAATGHAVSALEQRIDTLAAALSSSSGSGRDVSGLEQRIDSLAATLTAPSGPGRDVSGLEQRIDSLAATLTASGGAGHDVSALEQRIDSLAATLTSSAGAGPNVAALEQRIDSLAAALTASSEAGQAVPRDLERLLAGLIEKLEWVQLTHTDHAALAHLEDRIAALVQRFDASDARLGHLEAIERGLADLLVHLNEMRSGSSAVGALAAAPSPAVERDVAEIKANDRRTRDSLETVQETVEHVVNRLASIESGLRGEASAAGVPAVAPPQPVAAPDGPQSASVAPPLAPISAPVPEPATETSIGRKPIDPSLPPDHPLEPGSTPGRARSNLSPAERIAASEAAVGAVKPPVIADSGRPDFIAAARRAAQAAAAQRPGEKPTGAVGASATAQPKKRSERLHKLIVAGAAVLILLGGVRVAAKFFENGGVTVVPQTQPQAAPQQLAPPAAPPAMTPQKLPRPAEPTLPVPPPRALNAPAVEPPATREVVPQRESMQPQSVSPPATAVAPSAGGRHAAATLPSWASPDITGALPSPETAPITASQARRGGAAIADDKLPAAIGDAALRAAAMAGNPAAAYEVATRFSEGRGVPQDAQAAAHWLERAAQAGLAPAQFRLGGFYEKGVGVTKDLARARDLYEAAAAKGNGKAMHNLAVIYAEGVNGPPDYNKAAEWFRKAANHGVRDSQYNLGILYARGIGLQKNDAEAYKWFAIAADQGDKEAGAKRDEIASHLDPQTLAAARNAVKGWKAEPQPDDAINVKAAAAWNAPASPERTAKRK
jgi:localization factor PodJL